jgi:2-oxoglutarate ferredoxin oxidoreductase subunit alpha
LGLKAIQVLVISPFPAKNLRRAMSGVEKTICVECNSTGQLARLLQQNGYCVENQVLKFDGRPFSVDDLLAKLAGALE